MSDESIFKHNIRTMIDLNKRETNRNEYKTRFSMSSAQESRDIHKRLLL